MKEDCKIEKYVSRLRIAQLEDGKLVEYDICHEAGIEPPTPYYTEKCTRLGAGEVYSIDGRLQTGKKRPMVFYKENK